MVTKSTLVIAELEQQLIDDDDDDDDDDSQLQHVARRVIRAAEKHLAELQRITPTLPKNRQKMMLQATRSPTENCIPLDMFVHNL